MDAKLIDRVPFPLRFVFFLAMPKTYLNVLTLASLPFLPRRIEGESRGHKTKAGTLP